MLEPTHTLGDAWEESTWVGLKKASFTQQGFYDDESNGSNAALVGKTGVSRILCYGVSRNLKGLPVVGFQGAMQVTHQRVASRGALHRANSTYQGNGQVDEGLIIHDLVAEVTATGNTQGQSIDNGAGTSLGGVGYLQLTALTLGGYTNFVAYVQHSVDNAAWVDLLTFTAATTAPQAQRGTAGPTINRYLATRWVFNGAGAGPSATFMVAFARN